MLLSQINPKVSVITSLKRFEEDNRNQKLTKLLDIDKIATDIYTLGYRKNSRTGLDYTTGLILQ